MWYCILCPTKRSCSSTFMKFTAHCSKYVATIQLSGLFPRMEPSLSWHRTLVLLWNRDDDGRMQCSEAVGCIPLDLSVHVTNRDKSTESGNCLERLWKSPRKFTFRDEPQLLLDPVLHSPLRETTEVRMWVLRPGHARKLSIPLELSTRHYASMRPDDDYPDRALATLAIKWENQPTSPEALSRLPQPPRMH